MNQCLIYTLAGGLDSHRIFYDSSNHHITLVSQQASTMVYERESLPSYLLYPFIRSFLSRLETGTAL